jgi:hypothetical protein
MWDDLMIERLERMKAMLHQESLTSIAAGAIACRLSCLQARIASAACPRGAARAYNTNFVLCCVVHARAGRARAYRTNFTFSAQCTNESDFAKSGSACWLTFY